MKRNMRVMPLVALGFLLGVLAWPAFTALSGAAAAQGNCKTFPETGHTVCGRFLDYWQNHGGLAQQGYPISEEFVATSDINGKPYTMQYFQRAVFEYHPENQPPNDVLLTLLGTIVGQEQYTQGFPAQAGTTPFYDHQDSPDHTLRSFFNAVNRKEYERAYSYYEGAPDNVDPNLAPAYPQFAAGYANTASVTLAYGKYTVDAGAGNRFADVPVVLTATNNDKTTQMYSGCIILHRVAEGISDNPRDELWSVRSASVSQAPANSTVDGLLSGLTCQP